MRARAQSITAASPSVSRDGTGPAMYCACPPLRCGELTIVRAMVFATSAP